MSFDPVREFVGAKDAYARSRGATQVGTKTIPLTNWADVATFGAYFLSVTDDLDACFERARQEMSQIEAARLCNFTRTASYEVAAAAWRSTMPWAHVLPSTVVAKAETREVYPWNDAFWTLGLQFAIARSAAGVVPGKFSLAIESVTEAVQELPGTIGQVINHITPGLPDLSPLAEITKWAAIGGGLWLLYQYVLKPKKKPARK